MDRVREGCPSLTTVFISLHHGLQLTSILLSELSFVLPGTVVDLSNLLMETAMRPRPYRKILHSSYKDHVINEDVRAKIQQAIGPHQDLLTIVKRRELQWYGHVSRSSGLANIILQEDKEDKGRGGKTTSGNG